MIQFYIIFIRDISVPILLGYERYFQRDNAVNCTRNRLTWCIIKKIHVYINHVLFIKRDLTNSLGLKLQDAPRVWRRKDIYQKFNLEIL